MSFPSHRTSGQPEQSWGVDAIYCEATCTADDIFYVGSEDEDYTSPTERRHRYSLAARRYLNGNAPFLVSTSLRGPFGRSNGWTNPWAKRTNTTQNTQNTCVEQPAKCRKTNSGKKWEQTTPAEKYYPSPESLKQAPLTEEEHPFLEDDELQMVENWRENIISSPVKPNDTSNHRQPKRKRSAEHISWLKKPAKMAQFGRVLDCNAVTQRSPRKLEVIDLTLKDETLVPPNDSVLETKKPASLKETLWKPIPTMPTGPTKTPEMAAAAASLSSPVSLKNAKQKASSPAASESKLAEMPAQTETILNLDKNLGSPFKLLDLTNIESDESDLSSLSDMESLSNFDMSEVSDKKGPNTQLDLTNIETDESDLSSLSDMESISNFDFGEESEDVSDDEGPNAQLAQDAAEAAVVVDSQPTVIETIEIEIMEIETSLQTKLLSEQPTSNITDTASDAITEQMYCSKKSLQNAAIYPSIISNPRNITVEDSQDHELDQSQALRAIAEATVALVDSQTVELPNSSDAVSDDSQNSITSKENTVITPSIPSSQAAMAPNSTISTAQEEISVEKTPSAPSTPQKLRMSTPEPQPLTVASKIHVSTPEPQPLNGFSKIHVSTPEPQFQVQSFSLFISPSPRPSARTIRYTKYGRKSCLSVQSRFAASAGGSKHVSWAVELEDAVSPAAAREHSPPPVMSFAVSENDKFSNHFSAVVKRTDGQKSSKSVKEPLKFDSTSTMNATEESSDPVLEDKEPPRNREEDSVEPMDIVEDIFREMGEAWDIDSELVQARQSGDAQTAQPGW